MAFYAGFDTETYPGIDMMNWLQANTNLSWCGYYLAPAPNRSPTGWPGQFTSLSPQWGVVPIYVGQQDPTTGSGRYSPSSILTAAQGTQDGQAAANLAAGDQFPNGTCIYLDWESGGLTANGCDDYISGWTAAIVADGRFVPGIYCSHGIAQAIETLLGSLNPVPTVRFWCWKVTTTAAHPYTGSLTGIPTPDPAGCGYAEADAWQRDQDVYVAFPAGAPTAALTVDFSTSSAANPAAP